MYSIFTYIYHKNQPNVAKHATHGSYGIGKNTFPRLVSPAAFCMFRFALFGSLPAFDPQLLWRNARRLGDVFLSFGLMKGIWQISRVVATQMFFIFTLIPGEMIQFDEHILQMGWFNRQLVSNVMLPSLKLTAVRSWTWMEKEDDISWLGSRPMFRG